MNETFFKMLWHDVALHVTNRIILNFRKLSIKKNTYINET